MRGILTLTDSAGNVLNDARTGRIIRQSCDPQAPALDAPHIRADGEDEDLPSPKPRHRVSVEHVLDPVADPAPEGRKSWRSNRLDARHLQSRRFSPVRYIIPSILPEGVTLLAGRPKIGKSWFTLQIACSVAAGTTTLATDGDPPVAGDVLVLALEDNERRLQNPCAASTAARRCGLSG
jgi:AAA domain